MLGIPLGYTIALRAKKKNRPESRICKADSTGRCNCRVYGYINKKVSSTARLDHFLSEQYIAKNQKITVFSVNTDEFEKAIDGSRRPFHRVLDWFHIAMKCRVIEYSH